MQQILSPNMLKTFEHCPKKYYFKYIRTISMPTDNSIFELGKNIHAMASYYLSKQNIYKMENSLTEKESVIWEYLKTIDYFSYELVNTEYNLTFRLEDVFFGGRLDALVKKDNIYYILDYKTGAAPKNAAYDYQTIIYLLAVSIYFKTNNVKFVYIDLKARENIEIALTPELKNEYKTKLLEISKILSESSFNPICNSTSKLENKKCLNCEFNKVCY